MEQGTLFFGSRSSNKGTRVQCALFIYVQLLEHGTLLKFKVFVKIDFGSYNESLEPCL